MKARTIVWLLVACLAGGLKASDKLYLERLYEPIVLKAGPLYDSRVRGIPINELFLYAYDDVANSWRMMPFQFDERLRGPDLAKPEDSTAWRHSYFADDDGIFDEEDELVFMVRDLGDQAPSHVWIDDADSRMHSRLELSFSDPNDPESKAYAYLYRSTTITEPVPAPYSFSYDSTLDRIDSKYYGVSMSKQTGLITDILIKPPFGTGVDFFDTQKMRFAGTIDLFFQIDLEEDESLFYVYPYHKSTKKPIVRLIRETRQTIQLFGIVQDRIAFYVVTKFYPFSGTIDGGEKLDIESLRGAFPDAGDIYINFKYLRQSWDFNEAASGMRFYSRQNQDVLVDGMRDQIDTTVTLPVREWMLTSGVQGSLFTYTHFTDSVSHSMGLYFWDSLKGAPRDSADTVDEDTGDNFSYGDQGLYFRDVSSLRLGFIAYFLPAGLNKKDGERLAAQIANPVPPPQGSFVDFPTGVASNRGYSSIGFTLEQNYPNPFNHSTVIRFQLDRQGPVSLRVLDRNGRTVVQLLNRTMNPGSHLVSWDGRDQDQQEVASGLYFYELKSEKQSQRRTMVLLK